jgi:hypothetical protein
MKKVFAWAEKVFGWADDRLTGFAKFVGFLGWLFDLFLPVLQPTRGVLLIVAAYFGALMTPQGRELALSLAPSSGTDAGENWRLFITAVALLWFAVQTWWWSRILLDHRVENDRLARERRDAAGRLVKGEQVRKQAEAEALRATEDKSKAEGTTRPGAVPPENAEASGVIVEDAEDLKRIERRELKEDQYRVVLTPRVYALAIYLAAGITLWDSRQIPGLVIVVALAAVTVALFLLSRRDFIKKSKHRLAKALAPVPLKDRPMRGERKSLGLFTRWGLVMMTASYGVMLGSLALFYIWPVDTAWSLGALAVVVLGLSAVLPLIAAVSVNRAASRAPVLAALLLWAVLLSLIPGLDHHRVRSLNSDVASATLAARYDAWNKLNAEKPMVLVYSAGGGLRAGYWTADLLGLLEDCVPNFHQHVFAISGVSGGSVGAVYWQAALTDHAKADDGLKDRTWNVDNNFCPAGISKEGKSNYRAGLRLALGQDYLAPAAGALLYRDLVHAFLPCPWMADRAAVLEKAWERGYQRIYGGSDQLGLGFHTLWNAPGNDWRPILLLNGTHQETGQRIITSDIEIDADTFPHTFDFFEVSGNKEIRASTAALNSARFTYVSPAGRIFNGEKFLGHVLDGGYFENYGARSLRDLRAKLTRLFPDWDRNRKIILIEIVNDTDLSDEDANRGESKKFVAIPEDDSEIHGLMNHGLLNEAVAPIQGLFGTRGARGVLEAKLGTRYREENLPIKMTDPKQTATPEQAKAETASAPNAQAMIVQLRLCPDLSSTPPLGWVLGQNSSDAMDNLINGKAEFKPGDDGKVPQAAIDCQKNLTTALQDLVTALQ